MAHLLPFAPPVSLAGSHVSPTIRALVPERLLKKHVAFPVRYEAGRGRGSLVLAITNPHNLAALDEIAFATGLEVRPVQGDDAEIRALLGLADDTVKRDEPAPAQTVEPLEFNAGEEDPGAELEWFFPVGETRYY
ncbi:MAG TPA: hypothetical protein VMK42_07320 [Anaeromyxobacteraceae bacterium]|nr:hypothetical protein [Anaeromyxobacteraceae bacterium]